MPTFENPWLLLLLPLAPLLAWWHLRRRRPALRFSDTRLFDGLPPGRGRWVRRTEAGLHGAAALAALLALAGPRWPVPTPITTEGIALVLAVDVSGSMREGNLDWNGQILGRLDAAKRVFRLFVQGGPAPDGTVFPGRPNDLIGLVAFATYPETLAPLTPSHSSLLQRLDQEQPAGIAEAQTNIGDAIAESLLRLDAAGDQRKVLVLITDGEHNFPGPVDSPTWTPRKAARRAADLGVPVYVIDAGDDALAPDPASRAAAKESMQEVAAVTGGAYFPVRDTAELLKVCKRIDQFERRPVPSFRYRRFRELHPWFGLAAAGLLIAARLFAATVARRVP